MAGLSMSLTLRVSNPRAVQKLRGMSDPAKKRLNRQLANAMRNSTLDRFRRGVGPDEQPWEPVGGTARSAAQAEGMDARARSLRLSRQRKSGAARAKALLRQASRLSERATDMQRRSVAGDRFDQRRLRGRVADMQRRAAQLRSRASALASGKATVRQDLAKRRAALYRRARAARKYAERHVPLNDTGRLRSSITTRASADEAAVGTNVVYARIHQYGGKTGRRGARFIMKARPYLGFNAEDRRVSLAIVEATIKETILP